MRSREVCSMHCEVFPGFWIVYNTLESISWAYSSTMYYLELHAGGILLCSVCIRLCSSFSFCRNVAGMAFVVGWLKCCWPYSRSCGSLGFRYSCRLPRSIHYDVKIVSVCASRFRWYAYFFSISPQPLYFSTWNNWCATIGNIQTLDHPLRRGKKT